MRIPSGLWKLTKEVARHVLRRPVVGIAALARTPDGRIVLIRRSDSGQWALPGGTLERYEFRRPGCRSSFCTNFLDRRSLFAFGLFRRATHCCISAVKPHCRAWALGIRGHLCEPIRL